MDYLRVEHLDQRVDGFMPIMNQKAARAISEFVQENLSNWYVRLQKTLLERRICAGQNRGLPNFIYVFVNHK
jgi:isoleucyl-tRNA synthetase